MKRLEFYVQHMLRQDAESILMRSEQPVEFHFSTGKVRRSNGAIPHKQLSQLIKEAAPSSAADQVRKKGVARFNCDTDSGAVKVEVHARKKGAWKVLISRAANDNDDVFGGQQPGGWDGGGGEEEDPFERGSLHTSTAHSELDLDPGPGASALDLDPGFGASEPAPERSRGRARERERERPREGERPRDRERGRDRERDRRDAAREPSRRRREDSRRKKPATAMDLESELFDELPDVPSKPPPKSALVSANDPIPEEFGRVKLAEGEPRVNYYLRMMKSMGASDLHLVSGVKPMIRLHGEMRPIDNAAEPLRERELREIMLEVCDEEQKQHFADVMDLDFAHEIKKVGRFRMNYFMDRTGPGAVARQIPFEILSPDVLGIPQKVLELCWLTKGLVLVTGPTGSGKSTTLASLIDVVNASRADHIITIEDPIEFVHPNKKCLVNQREVGLHTRSFKNALRAALREDPDIVLVGELRDLETISIAVETAETGHLVFGTLHTTTAPSTVDRIIDQFPSDRQSQIRTMLAESLRGVVSQVLCKKVGGGRVGAYEVLLCTSAVSNLIREGKTFQLKSVMQTGRNLGMQTMNDHLLDLVKAGVVEPKEAYMKANDKQLLRELFQKNRIPLDLDESGQ